jgi:PPOX class probable F420-dependent enzyme
MPDIDDVHDFLSDEHGLAVVSTTQADGRVLSSVVNCGVIDHPLTGERTLGLVSRGDAARLGHVRRGSEVTIVARRGWRWVGVTGPAELIGPDDGSDGVDRERLRLMLREVFRAAGGDHDDYDEYDRVMTEERRTCMFVSPDRILGNFQ